MSILNRRVSLFATQEQINVIDAMDDKFHKACLGGLLTCAWDERGDHWFVPTILGAELLQTKEFEGEFTALANSFPEEIQEVEDEFAEASPQHLNRLPGNPGFFDHPDTYKNN